MNQKTKYEKELNMKDKLIYTEDDIIDLLTKSIINNNTKDDVINCLNDYSYNNKDMHMINKCKNNILNK